MDRSFKTEVMRNNTDMSKWASWQQQQTLEELNKLKSSVIGIDGKVSTAVKPLDPQTILSKNSRLLSKFTAKKLSQSGPVASSTMPGYPYGNAPALSASGGSPRAGFASTASVTGPQDWPESAHLAVRRLEDEREALLREKQAWLARINEDNTKLAAVLKDVSNVKRRVLDRMALLDEEKDKLRALQINFAQNRFEKSFFAGSRLAPANRQPFIAQGRGDKAEEVYCQLQALWARIKSNQLEVVDFAVSYIKDVEECMVQGLEDEVDTYLNQLNSIASGRPGNILAAKALSSNLSEAVVNALMERNLAPLLLKPTPAPEDEEEHQLTTNYDYFFGPNTNSSQQQQQSQAQTLSYNDIKDILAQNQALKSQLQSMKTKCAQLKQKALTAQQQLEQQQLLMGTPGNNSSRSGSNNRRGGNNTSNSSPIGNNSSSNNVFAASTNSMMYMDDLAANFGGGAGIAGMSKANNTSRQLQPTTNFEDLDGALASMAISEADGGGEREPERRLSDGSASFMSPEENFDRLPTMIKDVCFDTLSQRVQEVLESHPLFPSLRSSLHPSVLSATVSELADQMKGSVSVILTTMDEVTAAVETVEKQQQQALDASDPTTTELDEPSSVENFGSIRLTLQGAVNNVMDSIPIQAELGTLTMMALTFLHQRYKVASV